MHPSLPELLVMLAIIIMVFGVFRLTNDSEARMRSSMRTQIILAVIVFVVLVALRMFGVLRGEAVAY